jgi:Uncharacterised nucleotidyltransferase
VGLETWLARLSDPDGITDRALPALQPGQIDFLIDLSIRHNVQLAVLKNLIDLAKADLSQSPDAADAKARLQSLRGRRFAEVANNTVIANTAREVMAKMDGLPLALVKGLDFAENAYKGVETRKFSDVDLLIDPSCEAEVNRRLTDLGYVLFEPKGKKIEQSERQWTKRGANTGLSLVEIHTDLVHDPKLRRKMTLTYELYASPANGGVSNASRLVVAAVHGAASHLFGRLQYVIDGMMIARAGVDPHELRIRTQASGALLPLVTMLRLAGNIYECNASEALLASLGKTPAPRLESLLISPQMVLAAKNRNRWRYLPQRHLYRQLLAYH